MAASIVPPKSESGRPGLALCASRAAFAWLLAGFVVLGVYCVAEAASNPGLSVIDAYWRGRLPWMGIAETLIVSGATVCAVVGAGTVLLRGGWQRRVMVILALWPIALWWFFGIVGLPGGGVCFPAPCAPRPIDPWAVAYSAPETAVLFLILPAVFIATLALTMRTARPR